MIRLGSGLSADTFAESSAPSKALVTFKVTILDWSMAISWLENCKVICIEILVTVIEKGMN